MADDDFSIVNDTKILDIDSNNTDNSNLTPLIEISGLVQDCKTDEPLPDVTILVKNLQGLEMGRTQTDAHGLYKVSFSSKDSIFNVIASLNGHVSPSQEVEVENINQIKTAQVNFHLGQPAVTVTSPGETFINENFQMSFTFNNEATSTGFGPILELILPPEISFNAATYLGSAIRSTNLGIFPLSGELLNPLTREMVTGTPGFSLWVLEYPFGSFTPDQPPATLLASFTMAANATLGVPLNVTTNPIFRFGNTPLDDPTTDPPIHGNTVVTTVTPTVIRLTKNAIMPEDETATGPNYPRTYQLILDIADGATLTNVNVTDLLPSNLQFIQVIDAAGGTIINTPSLTIPGGNLTINFPSITGVLGVDRVITYQVYAPEFDNTLQPVIDPNTGAPVPSFNNSTAQGNYNGTTVTSDGPSTEYTVTLKSLAVQKSVSDLSGPPTRPTNTLEYTINFQVSDYFQLRNVTLTDVVGDGQSFLSSFIPLLRITENGTTTNLPFVPSNYEVTHNNITGTWTIIFYVSNQLLDWGLDEVLTGGLYNNRTDNRGPTTGTITFRTIIDIEYEDPANFPSGDPLLTSNDVTTNQVTANANLTHNHHPVSDGSGTSVVIVAPTIEKSIYAINGNTTIGNPPYFLKPGDDVTFSLKVWVPTTNLENFSIVDFLPIPFFNATQVTTNIAQGNTPPGAGEWRLAADDTLSTFLGFLPTLTTNATDNNLIFNYGLVNSTDQITRLVHILFTVTATNEPMADELYLTNQMNIMYDNSPGDMFSDNAIIQFITQQPVLVITKGISGTTGSGTITPDPSILPVNGDLNGADAGDKVTYVITVENQGSWNAYDVIIRDNIPAGLINPTLISVIYGNGTPITNFTGNLFAAGGLILNNILYRNDGTKGPPYGNDTVFITFTFDIAPDVYPRQAINNTAEILNFASTPDGPNFVQDQSLFHDQAGVTIADPTISKDLVNSTDPGTSGNNLTIGELGTFRFLITLPEGQMTNLTITDLLPAGIIYTGNYVLNLTGFNGTLGNLIVTSVGNTITFLFNGTTIVNPDNLNETNSFYIDVDLVVENNETTNPRTPSSLPKTNTVRLDWDENPAAPVSANYNFNVLQPWLNVVKTILPNPVSGGQQTTVRLNLSNSGLSPAYNVVIVDPLNGTAFNWTTVTSAITPPGFTFNYNSSSGIVTYTGGNINPGESLNFTFNVNIMDDVKSNSTFLNTATATYDSLSSTTTPRDNNREYTSQGSTNLRTIAPAVVKGVFNTSEPDSTGNNVLIGEVVTYRIDITIPSGTTANVNISDIINTRLAYIGGRALISRSSSNVFADGFIFTSTGLTDFQSITPTSTNPLIFFLGNITNNNLLGNETIRILFDVVVKNNVSNNVNGTIPNTGTLNYTNEAGQSLSTSSSAPGLTVRRPVLTINKTATPTIQQGGEPVTFNIVVRNTAGTNIAPVYDLVVTDIIHPNFINIRALNGTLNQVTITTSNVTITANYTLIGNNLTVNIDRLLQGQNVTISFIADLKEDIIFNTTTPNTANVTGTSLPGPNGTGGVTPGAPGTETGERTGDPSQGTVNNIWATSTVNVTSRSPSIIKNSEGLPLVNRTIGDTANQTIIVAVPQGTTLRLRVTDRMPVGLVASNFTYIISPSLSVQYPDPIPVFNSTSNTWEFDFGEINATAPGNITINYTVLVENILSNQNGLNLINNATVFYFNGATEINGGSATSTVRVIEPDLQLIKTGSTNVNPGDTVEFTLQINHTNQSTSNAYDLVLDDVIPGGMTYLDTTLLPAGWLVDTTLLPGLVRFTGPSLLLGDNATIIFRCVVDNNISLAGQDLINIANLTYTSLSGPSPDERTYNTTDSAIVHILGADIYINKAGPPNIFAGQQINYTLTIGNNGPDTAVNVILNDLIDPAWYSLLTGVEYNLNGTWYAFSNPLNLALGNISTSQIITILIRGNLSSAAPLGTINNTAQVTSDTPDPDPDNNTAQAITQVNQQADLNKNRAFHYTGWSKN